MIEHREPTEEEKIFGRLAHEYYALVKPEDLHIAQELLGQMVSHILFMKDKPQI